MVTKRRMQKIKDVALNRQEGIIVLEDIYDPHNAQAVFRTCEVFGFQTVYLIFEKEKRFNPKRVGRVSSSSANKWLDFKVYDSTKKCLKDLKKKGYEIISTVMTEDTESLFEAKIEKKKIAILLGNEHRGLSETAIALSDRKVMIPMSGMVQSLNLSVSAAIFISEVERQRHEKGIEKYLLPLKVRKKLEKDFLKR